MTRCLCWFRFWVFVPLFLRLHLTSGIHREAITHVRIEGVEIIHVPLFEVLDPKDPRDYFDRVEPSVMGGFKMAQHLVGLI